jgi:hypothetical protein
MYFLVPVPHPRERVFAEDAGDLGCADFDYRVERGYAQLLLN